MRTPGFKPNDQGQDPAYLPSSSSVAVAQTIIQLELACFLCPVGYGSQSRAPGWLLCDLPPTDQRHRVVVIDALCAGGGHSSGPFPQSRRLLFLVCSVSQVLILRSVSGTSMLVLT